MPAPGTVPNWDTNQTNTAAPTGGQTTDGFAVNDVPTSGLVNWLFYWIGKWLAFFADIYAQNQAMKSLGADMGSAKITHVADPTVSTDAATKNYVDAHGTSLLPFSGNASNAGTQQYLFPRAGISTASPTALAVTEAVIIPFDYTILGFYWRVATADTNEAPNVMISKNGAAAAALGAMAIASTHGVGTGLANNTGNAGDYIELGISAGTAGWTPGQSEVSLWIRPT